MNPIRREVLNGLFVLVISTLLSAAIAAFEIKFNLQVWVLIVMAVAIAIGGYVTFEIALGHMAATAESTRLREEEWLKRVGNPARLVVPRDGVSGGADVVLEAIRNISPGGTYTVMYYFGSAGSTESPLIKEMDARRDQAHSLVLERLKRGALSEYKRIVCFDHDVLANDHELKSGVLRVGVGPAAIDRATGEHCRLMMETKGCSLFLAPAVLRFHVMLCGADKVGMTVETADPSTGGRTLAALIFFSDPPNGEIVEQFRQMERETERRMVAVHKIVFPEDAEPTADLAAC